MTGRIEVDGLCVEYEPGKPVLRGVSFAAEPGETIAILGKTGSGKSTLTAALVRLVEAKSGSIRIDGVDIRLFDRRHLREVVGLVLQEPYLFSRSMRENVELGTGKLSDDEIERASRLSGLVPVVASFEGKWDTAVGEEGVKVAAHLREDLLLRRREAQPIADQLARVLGKIAEVAARFLVRVLLAAVGRVRRGAGAPDLVAGPRKPWWT